MQDILSDEYQEKLRQGLKEFFESTKAEREKLEEEVKQAEFLPFSISNQDEWDTYVEKNTDPYGKAILLFASTWANLMEKELKDEFNPSDELIDKLANEASDSVGGITGFMYGAGVKVLADCWRYGKELNKWHNKKYGQEDAKGTVNPAILTIV